MVRKGYVQLVNGFYMNRKVRKLRHTCPSAIGAFAMMLTFCGDNLSDGHISEDDALYVLDITDSELDALCEVGMIEPDGNNGYYIHDYLAHNRSREQVQKKRESNAENYQKNKNKAKTSDSDNFQTAESRLNRDKHQNTRTPEELSKDNSTPPTPSKPDFAGLLDSLERLYPTNRFDGKTSQARMQLEIEWPKIVKAAGEADPFEFLEAKTRAYVGATEERFVKTFSRFIGGELYARNWEKPKPETPRARQVQPVKSRSQQNLEANMAKTWQYMTEEERARYSQGGFNAQQG